MPPTVRMTDVIAHVALKSLLFAYILNLEKRSIFNKMRYRLIT